MSIEPDVPLSTREVSDVETLKALSDPLRLAILGILMDGAHETPKVRTVKEMAEELAEPPTKLYRHIKQLEARGLIVVAETRVVSGIVEYRYRAGQRSLHMDPRIFNPDDISTDDALAAWSALLDSYANDFAVALRAGKVSFEDDPEHPGRKALGTMISAKVSPADAADYRGRMAALVDDMMANKYDPDGVPVRVFVSFYTPSD
ncbi:MAG TPA: helix-turn-helix domain-containing protein [Pseudonocardiaceae bacterium]|nr:helix-turn-helix domain-containing protein [Pseudonocardiaceae bacterium]